MTSDNADRFGQIALLLADLDKSRKATVAGSARHRLTRDRGLREAACDNGPI